MRESLHVKEDVPNINPVALTCLAVRKEKRTRKYPEQICIPFV